MEMTHFFSGSALGEVDGSGRVTLPAFVTRAISRRCDDRTVTFGGHESASCLTAYDSTYARVLHGELERRRLRGEAEGEPAQAHHARTRRAFGLVEDARFDDRGRVKLPAMIRTRGRIERKVLFVGTGATFEIWNPEIARRDSDPDLRQLAEFHLNDGDR